MDKNKELFQEISDKLSVLIALMTLPDSSERKLSENIELLSRLGLSNTEIARILDAKKGTVEVTKSRIKKQR